MKFIRAFGQFWYDFIIGDDWKIAVAVVLALGLTAALLLIGSFSDSAVAVFGGVAVIVAFTTSLVIDVRQP